MNKVTAVVLASGLSVRMGCNKLLLEADGKPLAACVMEVLKPFDFQEVLVVTGYDAIMKMADTFGYRTIFNDAPEIGQSRSVVLGVTASRNSEGWLFLNADMPWLLPDTLQKILAAARERSNIIVPRYDGRPGQPVYFPARFYEELKRLTGDQGGRQVIRQHPEAVDYLDIEDSKQGIDIDTPEDYRRFAMHLFSEEAYQKD